MIKIILVLVVSMILIFDSRRYYTRNRDRWMEKYITNDAEGFHVWSPTLTKIIAGPFHYEWQAKWALRSYTKQLEKIFRVN